MTVKYICKRCNYDTNLYKDLFKHLLKKKICNRNIGSYKYSDDKLLILSIIPHNNSVHDIDEKELDFLDNSDILYENRKELFNELENINIKKNKTCKFCNESFTRLCDIRKHLSKKCFYQELHNRISKIKSDKDNDQINILSNYNIGNTTNNSNNNINNNSNNINNSNNNITNNNNIYLNIKTPIPFDDKWDISKIDDKTKMYIVFNKLMYTTLLEEILKNDTNLNVIIDKKSDSGIVYKNDNEEYIEMKLKDIVNKSMEKLENQLLDINKDVKNFITDEYHTHNRRMITKKLNDYNKNDNLQNNVINCISNTFNQYKNNAINLSEKIINNKSNDTTKII
jgi:hypothetical protein